MITTPEIFYQRLDALFDAGEMQKVEQCLEQAHAEAVAARCCGKEGYVDATMLLIAVVNEQASFYRGRSDWKRCLPLYDLLLTELESIGRQRDVNYAVAKINRATAYRFMGEGIKARAEFDEAEQILETKGYRDPYVLATLYNNRAPILTELGDHAQAAGDFERALMLLRQREGTIQEQAITLASLALVWLKLGDGDSAERCARKAMDLYETAGEGMHSGGILSAMAACCVFRGSPEMAAPLYRKAAEITEKYFGQNQEYRICMENYRQALQMAEGAGKQ